MHGPTLPSASDLVLARETAAEVHDADRKNERKRARVEALERVEDMVGPKEVGREGMLEKKRARREADRAMRDKGDDGFEADERTLLGGGDSFKEQCVPFSPCRHCGTPRRCCFLCPGWLDEMQRVGDSRRSAVRGEKRRCLLQESGQMRCARRTRPRWTCSNNWLSRDLADLRCGMVGTIFTIASGQEILMSPTWCPTGLPSIRDTNALDITSLHFGTE